MVASQHVDVLNVTELDTLNGEFYSMWIISQ